MIGSLIQPYDILMLAVLVLATWYGAWKGMAWQIASVASLVVSFLVAARCSGLLAPHLSDNEPWNRVLAMLILFVVTSAAVWIVFRFVAGLISKVKLKEFDRQMGALLGVVKGVLLCVLITFFAVTLSEAARQRVLQSRSGYYIAILIDRTDPVLPDDVHNVLGKYIEELDRKLDPNGVPEKPLSAQRKTDAAAEPDGTALGSQLGIERVQQGVGDVQQGVEGVRRRLDDFGRDVEDVRGSLEQLGETLGREAADVRDRVGDLRSGGEELGTPRR